MTVIVLNNTSLPIHVATSWDNIIQEFNNNVIPNQQCVLKPPPGILEDDEGNYSSAGWQDFLVIGPGTPDNMINHDHDWIAALGLAATALGTITAIAGLVMVPPVAAGALSALICTTAGQAAVAGAIGGLAGLVVTVGDFVANPATVSGLWCPQTYQITVTGGQVCGEKIGDTIKITSISSLKVSWWNKDTNTSGEA